LKRSGDTHCFLKQSELWLPLAAKRCELLSHVAIFLESPQSGLSFSFFDFLT